MLNLYVSKNRVLRGRTGPNICKLASTKSDEVPVLTEGKLEADFCYHLEFDENVLKYECQPLGFFIAWTVVTLLPMRKDLTTLLIFKFGIKINQLGIMK